VVLIARVWDESKGQLWHKNTRDMKHMLQVTDTGSHDDDREDLERRSHSDEPFRYSLFD
jgi:hypothetical protein